MTASEWGDDEYDGIEAEPIDVDDDAPPAAPGRAFGVDIGGLAGEYVDAEVKNAVRKQVADVAATAVSEALTPELIEALRTRAAVAAQTAVEEQVEANEADPADDNAQDETELYFGSVDEFVREYLRNVYRRRVDGRGTQRVWAAEWWKYPEAVIRLEALWRSWEKLRQDPSMGMSVWWRDHADHHMAVLLDPSGPFAKATGDENSNGPDEPLPYAAPPEGLYPDERQQPVTAG